MSKESEWLLEKYREWEKKTGRRQSVANFARYCGVSDASMGRWMRGDSTPDFENTVQLARILGYEVYEVMGWEPPEDVKEITELRAKLAAARSAEKQMQIVEDYLRKYGIIR